MDMFPFCQMMDRYIPAQQIFGSYSGKLPGTEPVGDPIQAKSLAEFKASKTIESVFVFWECVSFTGVGLRLNEDQAENLFHHLSSDQRYVYTEKCRWIRRAWGETM